MVKKRTRLQVLIIGKSGSLRSRSLQSWVENDSSGVEVNFVSPVILQNSVVPKMLDTYLSLHYGSRLTNGEWGCSIAHLTAQKQARLIGAEWSLFLEDDAEIGPNFTSSLFALLGLLPKVEDGACAVQCFGNSVETMELEGGFQIIQLPTGEIPLGAVGYLMNYLGLEKATSSCYRGFPIGKADFPAWAVEVQWLSASPSLVSHSEASPSLVGQRISASRKRGPFFRIYHASVRLMLSVLPFPGVNRKLFWELGHFGKKLSAERSLRPKKWYVGNKNLRDK